MLTIMRAKCCKCKFKDATLTTRLRPNHTSPLVRGQYSAQGIPPAPLRVSRGVRTVCGTLPPSSQHRAINSSLFVLELHPTTHPRHPHRKHPHRKQQCLKQLHRKPNLPPRRLHLRLRLPILSAHGPRRASRVLKEMGASTNLFLK